MTYQDEKYEGPSKVTCPCGFEGISPDPQIAYQMLTEHPCPNRPVEVPKPWISYVFNFWTYLIVLLICLTIITNIIATHK